MKRKNELKWLVVALLILILICILLTAAIIVHKINSEPVERVSMEIDPYTKTRMADIPSFDNKIEDEAMETINHSLDEIHVLITNGDASYFNSLYMSSDVEWMINDQPVNAGDSINIGEYLKIKSMDMATITLIDSNGAFSIMDESENVKKTGYIGKFEVYQYDKENQGVVLVNILPIEEYIRFVLPSEMPSYFPLEALKAQAVCARTLAIRQRVNEEYQKWNANLDDSTNYQVFNEFGTNEMADLAVEQTKGEILTYDHLPIECYYYSTNSGNTNDLSVWENTTLPYLKAKRLTQYSDVDFKDNTVLSEFLNSAPVSYDMYSPFYRWSVTLDFSNVFDELYGKIKGFEISKRCETGYVTEIKIKYDSGTVLLENEYEIRKFLGKALTTIQLNDETERNDFHIVPSSCFVIDSEENDRYVLKGAGFGHGIGLSQYGASKMAEDGLNYRAILEYYYESATVENMSNILQN